VVWRSFANELHTDEMLSTRRVCGGGKCFMVPAQYLGDGPHLIGITDATYAGANVCALPLGYYTSVNGFSFDQFGSFPATLIPINEAASRVFYLVTVDSTLLLPLFSTARIAGTSFVASHGASNVLQAAVHVENTGPRQSEFVVELERCSDMHVLIQGQHVQQLAPYGSATFHFMLYLDRRSSALNASLLECNARVSGAAGGVVYDTAVITSPGHGLRSAVCTVDQGQAPACTPVNCFTKYSGARNWYNPRTGLCEAVPVCNNTTIYDATSNVCVSQDQLATSLLPPPPSFNFTVPQFQLGALEPGGNTTSSIQCIHGNVTAVGCVCDNGWVTYPTQPAYQFVYCNAQLGSNSTEGSGSALSVGTLMTVALVIVVLLIALCVCCCVIKVRKRTARRTLQHQDETAMRNSLQQAATQLDHSANISSIRSGIPENSW
jgi:hypothetical protein